MLHCVVLFILFSTTSFVGFMERNKTQLSAAVGGCKILFITFLFYVCILCCMFSCMYILLVCILCLHFMYVFLLVCVSCMLFTPRNGNEIQRIKVDHLITSS
jgi:hypothetical protein